MWISGFDPQVTINYFRQIILQNDMVLRSKTSMELFEAIETAGEVPVIQTGATTRHCFQSQDFSTDFGL